MKKLLFYFPVLIFFSRSIAQNGTQDLIYARPVKDFIVLTPDFQAKSVDIVIDKYPNKYHNKTLRDKITLRMRPINQELNIFSTYFNPLTYTAILSDSTFTDSNFASLNQLFDAVGTMLNTLNSSIPVETQSIPKPDKEGEERPGFLNQPVADLLNNVYNPSLASWKYQYKLGKIDKCDNDLKKLILKLVLLDTSFYSKDAKSFEKKIQLWLKAVKDASTLKLLDTDVIELEQLVSELKATNINNLKTIDGLAAFSEEINTEIPAVTTAPFCREFFEYTKNFMEKVKTEYLNKQKIRTKLVESLTNLKDNLQVFIKNSQGEAVVLGRYPVEEENVHQITVVYKQREVKFDNNEITIAEQSTLTSNKIYLRASHLLVPEFATGIFYTNLTYPKFGTKTIDSAQYISDAGVERYPAILAAHLNLVFNFFDSPIIPMIQIGIGTAKERPSLLAGGGLRFLKPRNLAISYGRLWTWKKELNTLNIGDKVSGTAAVESDLKYFLDKQSAYYVGIQYNF